MTSRRSSTSLSSSPCSDVATEYVIINIADHNYDYDYDCDNNVFFIDSCYNDDDGRKNKDENNNNNNVNINKVNDDDDDDDDYNGNCNGNSKNKKTIKYLINCCCWYKFAYKNTTTAIQHEQPSLLLLPILAESSFLRSLRIYNKSDIIEVNKVTET